MLVMFLTFLKCNTCSSKLEDTENKQTEKKAKKLGDNWWAASK